MTVELGEDGALGLDGFGTVLLHEVGARRRLGERGGRRDAGGSRSRIVHEAVRGEIVEGSADQAGRGGERRLARVGEPHVPARAGEDNGPGSADEASAYDRGGRHGRSSFPNP